LEEKGLSKQAVLFWNANNVFGFETIDFAKLSQATQLLTISRYMKERMRALKLETMVVPNGIPPRFWSKVDLKACNQLREMFPGTLLTKVGRYHPDKRWLMAVDSFAVCKENGLDPTLIFRGGNEEHGAQVRERAKSLGLSWATVTAHAGDNASILEAIEVHAASDIIELDFFVPESFLRTLYRSSNAVLANSGHEPFGLVGLEVMACGGVAITGSTGEEYVQNFHNGIALSSNDPKEIPVYLQELVSVPGLENRIRENGKATAKLFNWESVIEDLLRKVELVAWTKGIEL
jgi:glycosyltransferase involved in cell wall biosynthesis